MADASAESNASCGDRTMTDQGCSVSMQGDCDDIPEKVAHINSALPNGCLKHSLEENGRVKLVENSENDSRTIREGMVETSKSDDSFCKCDHVSEAGVDDSQENCVNTLMQKQNGNEACEQLLNECDIDHCSNEIAQISVVDDTCKNAYHPLEGGTGTCEGNGSDKVGDLEYVVYESELQMPDIMRLITKDLSEPYSIYTYRYFIHNWPRLCFLAMDRGKCVGAIVCKHDLHKKMVRRGYIAMLAVDQNYRRRGIGSHLVMKAIRAMVADECDEVVLETEITNKAALRLYENLGFLRDKRLFRYYLNGVDALRLKLWLR